MLLYLGSNIGNQIMKQRNSSPGDGNDDAKARRSRVSQADVPAYSLEHALRIPHAIGENYAFKPTSPLDVAAAITLSPQSSQFRMICGAAIAYGLTTGGYNSAQIEVTSLGRRIIAPTAEGDDQIAKREAALRPRVVHDFLEHYDGNKFPRDEIALNVLANMGVPRDATKRTFELIRETAKSVGFFREIKGSLYVTLGEKPVAAGEKEPRASTASDDVQPPVVAQDMTPATAENRRVFITHGKNKSFLDALKSLLSFGELEAVVSVERQSVSQPVPDKVLGDMRRCSAAIIHVDAEQKLLRQDGSVEVVLNPNVLIEVGAAMALYDRRFILLVKEGVRLPSNLQGLYVVTYAGDAMDGDTTIRLLKAIQDIKNHPPPKLASEG
jgi:predicted nucleotide-binding protein